MTAVTLQDLQARIGQVIGQSAWLTLDQQRIDGFADLTEDHEFIHVDLERAAQTPLGSTIAHGFLTMSMLSRMAEDVVPALAGSDMSLNYGLDRLRFITPVKSGARVRGVFTLLEVNSRGIDQVVTRWAVIMEIEGEPKPALAVEWLKLSYLASG
ncbi:MaoC family dehydratase [Sphingomonas crusticola]|uniref:MaoC family dehydratase n=1 Tax=Sphingomonas crusticola TaxID=1697973 RepID=UPI000E278B45|nr:MaoC family dehydratase [Sphingomonas crusticola]